MRRLEARSTWPLIPSFEKTAKRLSTSLERQKKSRYFLTNKIVF